MLRVVGISCHTAPLSLREKLAVSPGEYPGLLRELASRPGVEEVALLATCNRTELYLVDGPGGAPGDAARAFFRARGLSGGEADLLYEREGPDCVRHLFSVACGLDSPVLGESQVLGQVKGALARAREAGTAGPILNGLFSRAVAAAGRVHAETGLGAHACSASSAAVEAISQELGGLQGRRVLLLGAGKMAELAGRALRGRGAEVRVVSRNPARSGAVAERCGFAAMPWSELERGLGEADAVICGTAAPHLILDRERVARALARRGGAPGDDAGLRLVVADLAMPRNVDAAVATLPGVRLFDLDELQARARANLEYRRALAGRARDIIEAEVQGFGRWLAGRRVAPLIRAVRRRYESLARAELERALARLGPLAPGQRQVLEEMMGRLVNKGLHGPIKTMCRLAGDGRGWSALEVLAEALLTPGAREARGGCRGRTE